MTSTTKIKISGCSFSDNSRCFTEQESEWNENLFSMDVNLCSVEENSISFEIIMSIINNRS